MSYESKISRTLPVLPSLVEDGGKASCRNPHVSPYLDSLRPLAKSVKCFKAAFIKRDRRKQFSMRPILQIDPELRKALKDQKGDQVFHKPLTREPVGKETIEKTRDKRRMVYREVEFLSGEAASIAASDAMFVEIFNAAEKPLTVVEIANRCCEMGRVLTSDTISSMLGRLKRHILDHTGTELINTPLKTSGAPSVYSLGVRGHK